MSHLDEFQTEMTDKEALIRGLCRMGFTRNQIEVHTKAQQIIGYHGTEDNMVGHIIIRKQYAKIPSDLGWEFKNGCFVGHLDSYDYQRLGHKNAVVYNQAWNLKLLDNYNLEKSKMTLNARGIQVIECKDNRGRLQLRAKMVKTQSNLMKIHI